MITMNTKTMLLLLWGVLLGIALAFLSVLITLFALNCIPGCQIRRAPKPLPVEPRLPMKNAPSRGKTHFITFGYGFDFETKAAALAASMQTQVNGSSQAFSLNDVDVEFRTEHADIFQEKKGCGLWLWKPYLAQRVFDSIPENDVLIYLDAGQVLQIPIEQFVIQAVQSTSGGVCFAQRESQSEQTKGDIFVAMSMPESLWGNHAQMAAGIWVVQKRTTNSNFFAEWLKYACVPGLLDASPGQTPSFKYYKARNCRHDQPIYSLLTWKYGFDAVPYSQWPLRSNKTAKYRWTQWKSTFRTNLVELIEPKHV